MGQLYPVCSHCVTIRQPMQQVHCAHSIGVRLQSVTYNSSDATASIQQAKKQRRWQTFDTTTVITSTQNAEIDELILCELQAFKDLVILILIDWHFLLSWCTQITYQARGGKREGIHVFCCYAIYLHMARGNGLTVLQLSHWPEVQPHLVTIHLSQRPVPSSMCRYMV